MVESEENEVKFNYPIFPKLKEFVYDNIEDYFNVENTNEEIEEINQHMISAIYTNYNTKIDERERYISNILQKSVYDNNSIPFTINISKINHLNESDDDNDEYESICKYIHNLNNFLNFFEIRETNILSCSYSDISKTDNNYTVSRKNSLIVINNAQIFSHGKEKGNSHHYDISEQEKTTLSSDIIGGYGAFLRKIGEE